MLSGQQSLSRLYILLCFKALQEPVSITPACLQERKKKKQKKNKGTDCEAFQREEIWQVILFKKCVIKSTHLPFTYSLFSDEPGWKELQVRNQISMDESPGSSINTLNSLLNLSEPLF